MLPKKNIGAITIMSSFLGLTLSHIITAFIYFSYSNANGAVQKITRLASAVGVFEILFILALVVGAAMVFVYSDDFHSMGILGASAVLSIMSIAVHFPVVKENPTLLNAVALIMNISVLAIFALYAIFYSRREMKQMSMTIWIAGLWVSFLSIGCRAAAQKFTENKLYFMILAVVALISAVCYFIAYYSQRQSFE